VRKVRVVTALLRSPRSRLKALLRIVNYLHLRPYTNLVYVFPTGPVVGFARKLGVTAPKVEPQRFYDECIAMTVR